MPPRVAPRMPRPVFLAAPERGAGALSLLESLLRELEVATGGALRGSHVFVPHLQVGDVGVEVDADAWFARSLGALQEARVVVAVLDGATVDDNVAFFVGYAFAAEKPIVAYVTDGREKATMLAGACAEMVHDVHGLQAALARLLL